MTNYEKKLVRVRRTEVEVAQNILRCQNLCGLSWGVLGTLLAVLDPVVAAWEGFGLKHGANGFTNVCEGSIGVSSETLGGLLGLLRQSKRLQVRLRRLLEGSSGSKSQGL